MFLVCVLVLRGDEYMFGAQTSRNTHKHFESVLVCFLVFRGDMRTFEKHAKSHISVYVLLSCSGVMKTCVQHQQKKHTCFLACFLVFRCDENVFGAQKRAFQIYEQALTPIT